MIKLSETQHRNLARAEHAATGERDAELEALGVNSHAAKLRTTEARSLAAKDLVVERRPRGGYTTYDRGHAYVEITDKGRKVLAEVRAAREAEGLLADVSPLRPSRRYGQGHRFGNSR